MDKQPKRVRHAQVKRLLYGRPMTTRDIAKLLKVKYKTAREYLIELYESEQIDLYTRGTKPYKYIVHMRKT